MLFLINSNYGYNNYKHTARQILDSRGNWRLRRTWLEWRSENYSAARSGARSFFSKLLSFGIGELAISAVKACFVRSKMPQKLRRRRAPNCSISRNWRENEEAWTVRRIRRVWVRNAILAVLATYGAGRVAWSYINTSIAWLEPCNVPGDADDQRDERRSAALGAIDFLRNIWLFQLRNFADEARMSAEVAWQTFWKTKVILTTVGDEGVLRTWRQNGIMEPISLPFAPSSRLKLGVTLALRWMLRRASYAIGKYNLATEHESSADEMTRTYKALLERVPVFSRLRRIETKAVKTVEKTDHHLKAMAQLVMTISLNALFISVNWRKGWQCDLTESITHWLRRFRLFWWRRTPAGIWWVNYLWLEDRTIFTWRSVWVSN